MHSFILMMSSRRHKRLHLHLHGRHPVGSDANIQSTTGESCYLQYSNSLRGSELTEKRGSNRKRVGDEGGLLAFVAGERADGRTCAGVASSVGDFAAK